MTLALSKPHMTGSVTVHERFVRSVLFMACFLLVTLGTAPFPDLGDLRLLEPVGEGNPYGQIAIILLTTVLSIFLLAKAKRIVRIALTPALIMTLCWIALTAMLSRHPELALRRSVLAMLTVVNAIAFLLLPCGREHFGRLLAVGSLIVLMTCYVGVLLFPQFSIHQSTDVIESSLAGAWRGPFGHKNGAGASMVVLIFIGIYVTRTVSLVAGITIIAGASLFLPFTMSKSPIGFLPLALVLAFILLRLRHNAARWILIVVTLLVINLLTIGTVVIEPVKHMLAGLMPDSSFTGRDEIWRFALDHVLLKPVTGFGFQAFWGTSDLISRWNINESWGLRASDAHNGYLNLAVMIGLVGLALSLAWIVAEPLVALDAYRRKNFDPALTLLFTQIWIFGLCLSGVESVLFSGGDGLWFMMVVSIIGVRLQTGARLSG